MIGFFIQPLISQDNGKLPISSHSFLIFIYPRLFVLYLSITVLFLLCHFLITKSCHMPPINNCEIDLAPPNICQASRPVCLITESNSPQSSIFQLCHMKVGSLQLHSSEVGFLQLRSPEVGSLQLRSSEVGSL